MSNFLKVLETATYPIIEVKSAAAAVQTKPEVRPEEKLTLAERNYTINDFDHDARVMKSLYPNQTIDIEATERLVDEMFFERSDSIEAQNRVAQLGGELLELIRQESPYFD